MAPKTSGSYTARLCAREDLPRLGELGDEMHKESVFHQYAPYDADVWVGFLDRLVTSNSGFIVVIEHADDGIVGYTVDMISPFPFSNSEFHVSEYGFYIQPNHRGARGAMLARSLVTEVAKDLGAVCITAGTSANIDQEKTRRSFEKMGFETTGNTFVQRL